MRPQDPKSSKYKCANCKRDYITAPVRGTKKKCPYCMKDTLVEK